MSGSKLQALADAMMAQALRRPGKPVKRLLPRGLGLGFGLSPDRTEARLVIVRRDVEPGEIEVEIIRQAFRAPVDAQEEQINENGWLGVGLSWPWEGKSGNN